MATVLTRIPLRPMTADDLPLFAPLIDAAPYATCDYTRTVFFLWRDYFRMDAALEDGVLYSRLMAPETEDGMEDGLWYHNLPLGGDFREGCLRILEDCRARGDGCRFCTVPEEMLPRLREVYGEILAEPQRDFFDYVYDYDALSSVVGKKLAGQRNHIHQFERTYPDAVYTRVVPSDVPELLSFFDRFVKTHELTAPSAIAEAALLPEVIRRMDDYRLVGGVLRVGGEVVGFSLGEVKGDTLTVHVEKADASFVGAYPVIVRNFCRLFAGQGIRFVNREDDMGDEGLRYSKTSWHPTKLLPKYAVTVL